MCIYSASHCIVYNVILYNVCMYIPLYKEMKSTPSNKSQNIHMRHNAAAAGGVTDLVREDVSERSGLL